MRIAGLGVVALALSACGGGGSDSNSGNANVRLVNLSVGHASVDLKRDTTTLNAAVAYGAAGAYTAVPTDASSLDITAAGTTTSLARPSMTGTEKDRNYSILFYGAQGATNQFVVAEQEPVPTTANKSKVLLLNLAAGAGAVDIYLTRDNADLSTVQPTATAIAPGRADSYREVDSGNYRVRVTGPSVKTDLRLNIPTVGFETGKVYLLALTSAPASAMVNAVLVPYQAAPSTYANGLANVRVISALPRTATMSASVNGSQLLAEVGAPALSPYKTVEATNPVSFGWTLNGVAKPAVPLNLERSATYSVLVWGAPPEPAVVALKEDTSMPATGTARLRVLNAVAGLGPVSLSLNLSPAINAIPSGQMGVTTITNLAEELQVSVRAGATTVFTQNRRFVNGAQYTIYLTGAPGAIEAQLLQQ